MSFYSLEKVMGGLNQAIVDQNAESLIGYACKDKLQNSEASVYRRKNSSSKYSPQTEKSQTKRLNNLSPNKSKTPIRHNVTPMSCLTLGSSENADNSGLLRSNGLLSSPISDANILDKKRKNIGSSRKSSKNRLSKHTIETSKDKFAGEFIKLSKVRNEFPVLFSPEQGTSKLVTLNRKLSEFGVRVSPQTLDLDNAHNNLKLESRSSRYIENSISPQSDNLACKRSMIQRLCGRGDQNYGGQVYPTENKAKKQINQEHIVEQENDDMIPIPELAESFILGLEKNEDSTMDNKMSFLMKSINDSTIIAEINKFGSRDSIGVDILKHL
jgi:hypothetical protein